MNSPEHEIASVPYTHGYYRVLSPTMIATAMELAGLCPPDLDQPLNYCELGMGFGVSLVAHAACFPGMQFYGNDFNPEHVRYARALADDAQLDNVTLLEDGFDELLARDLPPMDFIVMHGIWSWISPRLRQVIVAFIARRLRPGGVVYVSHNALPGWSSLMPLRELMRLHARHLAPEACTPAEHASRAVAFMSDMQRNGATYFSAAPAVPHRLEHLRAEDPNYLPHEYLTPDWHPKYAHEVAGELAAAGLSFAARSHLEDHVDAHRLGCEARTHLASVPDAPLRETLRDYYLNTPFRCDLYSRGAARLADSERSARLLGRRWALVTPREDLAPEALDGPDGTLVRADEQQRMLDALAHGPRTLAHLLQQPALRAIGFERVQHTLLLLSGQGHVHPALPEHLQRAAQNGVDRFNAVALVRGTADGLHHITSSVTGQATGWTRMAMMQMDALQRGIDEPVAMVRAMQAQAATASAERLLEGSERFLAQEAPVLQRLGSL
jgi:SAM-dependent methyltransferase